MTEKEYNTCVEKHADNVYRFILKNIKDDDKASDIVQDAYEKMWMRRDGINPEKGKSYSKSEYMIEISLNLLFLKLNNELSVII